MKSWKWSQRRYEKAPDCVNYGYDCIDVIHAAVQSWDDVSTYQRSEKQSLWRNFLFMLIAQIGCLDVSPFRKKISIACL